MYLEKQRTHAIVAASWVGIFGNGLLAVAKIAIGLLSGSMAVLGDGIDSSTDILTSIITLVTGRIISKPPDIEHPYGHTRAEAIATKTLSFIIFFAGGQLALSAVERILRGSPGPIPEPIAIYITIVSILGKAALSLYKFRVGRRINSQMLIADAKNMRNDIVISSAVLLGLVFTFLLYLPLFDAVTALLVSIWILGVAYGIFTETNAELMEGHEDNEVYSRIFDAVDSVEGAFHPHRARVRKIGASYVVDLDIEVDGAKTVYEAHTIAQTTEREIASRLGNVYDVLVHVEPLGNIEDAEKYGVSRRKLSLYLDEIARRKTGESEGERNG